MREERVRKFLSVICILILCVVCLFGCGKKTETPKTDGTNAGTNASTDQTDTDSNDADNAVAGTEDEEIKDADAADAETTDTDAEVADTDADPDERAADADDTGINDSEDKSAGEDTSREEAEAEESLYAGKHIVKYPGRGYYMSDMNYSHMVASPKYHTLTQISSEANEIIDEDRWLYEHGFEDCRVGSQEGYYLYDGNYYYYRAGTNITDGNRSGITVYNKEFDTLVDLDFSEFVNPTDAQSEFTDVEVHYVYGNADGSIIYVSLGHNTYANDQPETAYIVAISMDNYAVLWKTCVQISNANNFVVIDDTIFTGYGFTDEPDYVYAIDRITGNIMEQYKVKTGPSYLYEQDGKLYVRTYDTNYVFEINNGE